MFELIAVEMSKWSREADGRVAARIAAGQGGQVIDRTIPCGCRLCGCACANHAVDHRDSRCGTHANLS